MPRITISYRRDDSGVIAGRMFDRLVIHYGRDAIFRDIDDVPLGVDFREHISAVLDASDIVLAIIGPRWLGPRGGQTRLSNEADPVRVEIEAALRKGMPLIPVLVMRGAMPQASQLPESLRDFAYRNAIQVDAGQDFDVHIARLVRAMDRILRQKADSGPVRQPQDGGEPLAASPVDAAAPPEATGLLEPEVAVRRVEDLLPVPDAAAPTASPDKRERRARGGAGHSGIAIAVAAGLLVGAAAAAAVAVLVGPALPPDVAAMATAKDAAETRASSLQTELAAARKKAAADETDLAAAQKTVADQNERLHELQTGGDQATKDLATQKDIAAKAQAQVQLLSAQVHALGDEKARAGKAEKELADAKNTVADQNRQLHELQTGGAQAAKDLAAQKDIAAKAQTQVQLLSAQVQALGDEKGHADKAEEDLAAEQQTNAAQKTRIEQLPHDLTTLGNRLAAAEAAQSAAKSPAAALPPAAVPDAGAVEASWTTDQKRAAQRALRAVVDFRGEPNGDFAAATRGAIKRFQAFDAAPATGILTEDERQQLLAMATRLAALLDRPASSPEGVGATAVKNGEARYAHAWNYETGKGVKPNPAEAAYWYGLAAKDGSAAALTNLGTLVARGFAGTKPSPADAEILWWAAAARGEATAMFDLGAMWEHGIGVNIDLVKAKAWYERAAARNLAAARAALRRLGG
jgi:TPR repeat protein